MPRDNTKIVVDNISKVFRERRKRPRTKNGDVGYGEENVVLDGISFDVKEGEFIMILGHSGCGKSTLLNIIAGFDSPTSGKVTIDDKEVKGTDPSRIFMFQQNALFPWLTVAQNIQVGLESLPENERLDKTMEYLSMVGLQDFANYYPYQISGGMGRLGELARTLAMDPEVMFMDEPFAALDFMTRCHMREEMLNLMAVFQKTILFITHDIDEAIQLGDKVLILSDRPAKIGKMFDLSKFSHPRDITGSEIAEIRHETYLQMGVNPII